MNNITIIILYSNKYSYHNIAIFFTEIGQFGFCISIIIIIIITDIKEVI